jgi:hypothetical protein
VATQLKASMDALWVPSLGFSTKKLNKLKLTEFDIFSVRECMRGSLNSQYVRAVSLIVSGCALACVFKALMPLGCCFLDQHDQKQVVIYSCNACQLCHLLFPRSLLLHGPFGSGYHSVC